MLLPKISKASFLSIFCDRENLIFIGTDFFQITFQEDIEHFAVIGIFQMEQFVQNNFILYFFWFVKQCFVEGQPTFAGTTCPFPFHGSDMNGIGLYADFFSQSHHFDF